MKQDPFEQPYQLYLKALAQKMKIINDQKLSEFNLNASQGMLLGAIERAVRNGQPISRKFLQNAMKLSGPSVTNLLNGLVNHQYIVRTAGTLDGRTFQIDITAKGRAVITEMEAVFVQTEKTLLKGMSAAEKRMFLKLLMQAYHNIDNNF